jgi:hypothetical protein
MRHFVGRSQHVAVALKARVLTERKYILKIYLGFPVLKVLCFWNDSPLGNYNEAQSAS